MDVQHCRPQSHVYEILAPTRIVGIANRRYVNGNVSFGPSDQWGYKPLGRNNPTQVFDIHATILHLLGIDHTRLAVRHDGVDRRLTDVHEHVIKDILS
ncbi:MAG: DUF1501 domain-containing protein [Pirellulaceae bacterium]|jgi:hypothetical protein|nr:DUF1501 domain-containing protein [Pirellulaceae bacterium]